ncbi:MATE family efflux transporter [bacterium]|nr:MATE family efflux transporter [bacterium]
MAKVTDLTQGNILKQLIKLALPIIGASFLQMTYSLTDMIWLGKLGNIAVAAVGIVGIFVWLGVSLLLLTRVGAEVGVSQSIGKKKPALVVKFALNALLLSLFVSITYGLVTFVFASPLIEFFKLEQSVMETAVSYLRIVSIGFLFAFTIPTFSGIYNGLGNSTRPFKSQNTSPLPALPIWQ